MQDHIEHVRPLVTLRTPLKLLPRIWLELIEPKMQRTEESTCWFWNGALNDDGEPVLQIRKPGSRNRVPVLVKRIVAGLFWDLKNHWDVIHGCKSKNCLNPRHFYVTAVQWKQHNRDKIINEMAARIARWAKEKRDVS